ncbi:D-alanyl-D-alanine carboxypeptidase [Roseburia sp. CLA-AA-H209]|uniref:D-alanyl-D-alanine carboxypeptidase family protein n=2 Tax=Roseburia TaxID=841 RepID=UPI003048B1C8|nr:D-alanyl-D-alanine carboxypeptidase [Roseburia sp. CLA-AA-H209]
MKKRRWKKMIALSLLFIFFSSNHIPAEPLPQDNPDETQEENEIEIEEPKNLYALSACLMDADSGRILFGKEEDVRRANASTTKIMTLIVTLEHADLNDVVTFSDYAASQPDVQLNGASGEQFLLKDLCFSLMLESHNDSAVAIAEHVAGSVEAFADLMNEKAAELGCMDTYFITPNGLDKEDENGFHGTTAADLARIMSYCIKESPMKETFLEITQTPSYSFSNIEGTRNYSCNNHNRFLTMMDGAISGKTGFTGNAGYCYVGALRRDDRTYVVALLGCGWPNNKNYKWSDTKQLMQYGIDSFEKVNLLELEIPKEAECPLKISGAKTEGYSRIKMTEVQNRTEEKQIENILLRKDESIEFKLERKQRLEAPVEAGTTVGTLKYILNGQVVREEELVLKDSVKAWDYRYSCLRMVDLFSL